MTAPAPVTTATDPIDAAAREAYAGLFAGLRPSASQVRRIAEVMVPACERLGEARATRPAAAA